MVQALKNGLVIGVKYIAIITAITFLTIGVDLIVGNHYIQTYNSRIYLISASIGLAIAFFCGFSFPIFLSRSICRYKTDYPDVPQKYINEICRGKLLQKYYLNISWISIVLSFMFDMDLYPTLVHSLMACGFVCLFWYFKYKKRYHNL